MTCSGPARPWSRAPTRCPSTGQPDLESRRQPGRRRRAPGTVERRQRRPLRPARRNRFTQLSLPAGNFDLTTGLPRNVTSPNIVDSDVWNGRTREVIGTMSHELMDNFGLDVSYIYRKDDHNFGAPDRRNSGHVGAPRVAERQHDGGADLPAFPPAADLGLGSTTRSRRASSGLPMLAIRSAARNTRSTRAGSSRRASA